MSRLHPVRETRIVVRRLPDGGLTKKGTGTATHSGSTCACIQDMAEPVPFSSALPDGGGGTTVCVSNHDEEHRATPADHDEERGAAYVCEKRETEAGKLSELEGVVKCINKRWKLLEALRPKESRLAPRRNSATRKSSPWDDAPRREQQAGWEGESALQPMHCVRHAGRDGRVAAKVDSQGRKPQEKAGWEGKLALQPMHCVRRARRDSRGAAKVDRANGPTPSRRNRWPVGPKLCFDRARPQGRCPRCTTQVKDPSGLVPLVNKVEWLRQASAKTTDPHVLVTWVKEIGSHAQPGEPHSPSGRAGRGLDAHSVSVVAFQPRSPAGQAGRGLTRLVYYNEGDALMGWENQGPSAQERAAFHGTKLAHFRPTPVYDSGSSLRRAGVFPSDTTCRPAATQRDGMPPVTERDGIGPTTQRGGMTPAEPAKSQAALQPMHCVRRAGRDGRVAAKVDSQGRKPQGKTYASGFNGTGNRRGSAKPRAGLVPSDATCRPTATQRDGMPPVTERHGMRGTTPCGGMPPGEPAKSRAALQPMHCVIATAHAVRLASLERRSWSPVWNGIPSAKR